MPTKKRPHKRSIELPERDSTYFLKLVLYVILGQLWLRIDPPIAGIHGIPLGLLVGLIFASHDHFVIDRKIEYATLIIVAIVSYFLPTGILI